MLCLLESVNAGLYLSMYYNPHVFIGQNSNRLCHFCPLKTEGRGCNILPNIGQHSQIRTNRTFYKSTLVKELQRLNEFAQDSLSAADCCRSDSRVRERSPRRKCNWHRTPTRWSTSTFADWTPTPCDSIPISIDA